MMPGPQKMLVEEPRSSGRALSIAVIALFFIWGGITSLNDILIPKLKGIFALTYAQAMLTQFAFFTAYALIALPAGKLVARIGFAKGIVLGLVVMALGCAMFVPASSYGLYAVFLGALFILAAGVTLLQVAANPLVTLLGSAHGAARRLTFAQAFNSLGTAVWPFVGAHVILGEGAGASSPSAASATILSDTYLAIACVLFLMAVAYWSVRSHFPVASDSAASTPGISLLRHRRLAYGVVSLFAYVGAEVTIGSMMVSYLMLPDTMALETHRAGQLLSVYWACAMVGRFVGAWIMRFFSAPALLQWGSLAAGGLVVASMVTGGWSSGSLLIAVGLANSIMFPTIFSLALTDLEPGEVAPASGLLCMAIVGGAIIPLVEGGLADCVGLTVSLSIPVACYASIAAYGWFCRISSSSDVR